MTSHNYALNLLFFCLFLSPLVAQRYEEVATRIIDALLASDKIHNNFLNLPDYGASIIFDGIWEVLERWPILAPRYLSLINAKLENFARTPETVGYKVLNNIRIPWTSTIGDEVGLFPIAYLARLSYYRKHPSGLYNRSMDINISTLVATEYVVPWPVRLKDGTIAADLGWPGQEGHGTFVWADDSFMGTGLLSHLSLLLDRRDLANIAGSMLLLIDSHLFDSASGLHFHGYNDFNKEHSCCKWGRANGWIMMAHVDALLAIARYGPSTLFDSVLDNFKKHAQGALAVQSPSGLWHEVLDVPSTFLETSCTAMFLYSFNTGVSKGWLDAATFKPAIQKAYAGMLTNIPLNGEVQNICEGTGIGTDVAFYEARGRNYLLSSPGLGSVLRAIASMDI
eukprot:TRINITY_DN1346_c0_g1_i2.p1 TRINITY_DN1346_c0_g1~~TRINITY_DN1346_c0_g1_i2.p1  ORF type:complete len:395 (-),score=47.50 TRINITY_DN1346_c0_g1_i2:73-1257(-)